MLVVRREVSQQFYLYGGVSMAELSEVKKLVLSLSDREIIALLGLQNNMNGKNSATRAGNSCRWIDKQLSGLNSEGMSRLKELEAQLDDISTAHHVDKKQVRYLRALKKMKLEVPRFFRESVDPRKLYSHLKSFCINHDIPDEIISRIVPALVTYIETGHMRPIIFVGEKGCGKTTAVRLLVEEALQIHTEVIKVPQTDGGHGMTGDCGTYQSSDVGCIAKAQLRSRSLLVAYIFDEIDKVTHNRNRASVDDELLSITDESNTDIFDNYLETTLVGLEHCPMFFTANDLQKINPILADRCMVIQFPEASASRIKSISKKYVEKKLASDLYSMIDFNYEFLFKSIDRLVNRNITSLRKHQQMIETVLENALDMALVREDNIPIPVTESMFTDAERAILATVKRTVGFVS